MTQTQQSDDLEETRFDLQQMLKEIEIENAGRTQTDVKQSDILNIFKKTSNEQEPRS